MRLAVDLLRADPARAWTLADLARAVSLSPSRFGTVFAATFGLTPFGFLRCVRVQEFAHLLRTTTDSISVCAASVGWAHTSNAIKRFRETTGLTPGAYRRLPTPGRGFHGHE
jgi:AraC-like DNA-binding protein